MLPSEETKSCEFRAAAPSLRVTERVIGATGGAMRGREHIINKQSALAHGAEGVRRGNVPAQSGGLAER